MYERAHSALLLKYKQIGFTTFSLLIISGYERENLRADLQF